MSQLSRKPVQLTLLASAMLSLSACSTTNPNIAGVGLDDVGYGLEVVGNKSLELGAIAWEGTKEFLYIGERPETEEYDEVDLALMDTGPEDASVPLNVKSLSMPRAPVGLAEQNPDNVMPQAPGLELDLNQPTLALGTAPTTNALQVQPEADIVVNASFDGDAAGTLVDTPVDSNIDDALLADTGAESTRVDDVLHEVGEGDNLWVIAKKTTGDANNWHIIADINNLAPDASVQAGQMLVIPADMVKPDYGKTEPVIAAAEPALPAAPAVADTGAAQVALNIPTQPAAAPAQPAAANAESMMANATALKIGEGETLWDFAKRTTGDATNWRNIAEKNLLSEQQIATIRPGQKIYVPDDLVRARDANGVLIAKGEEGTIPTATIGGTVPNAEAVAAAAAVLSDSSAPESGIKIVEAAYQPEDASAPVTAESLAVEANSEVASNDQLGRVMVRGTYYPKAVYNQADFSSSLLMRVSPGTQLKVSKAIGPWLEVQTDQGVGYVHSRDIK